ncbi:MAG: hypothetical protein RBS39_08710 [Phycisphaerales bacterium]|jgi:tetratricopeptide (TPR) repeat protein|nr:hypothetical protein [Phycisphaerales bacterium]
MPSIEQLERLLKVEPNDAFVLYGLAQEHAKAGNLDRAIEYYDRCIAVDAAYCYAYYHKARVQERMGDAAGTATTLRAGLDAAKHARDQKAVSEIRQYLSTLDERTRA